MAAHPLRLLLSMACSMAAFLAARLSLAAPRSARVWALDSERSLRSAASCFTRSDTSAALSSRFFRASLSASCSPAAPVQSSGAQALLGESSGPARPTAAHAVCFVLHACHHPLSAILEAQTY